MCGNASELALADRTPTCTPGSGAAPCCTPRKCQFQSGSLHSCICAHRQVGQRGGQWWWRIREGWPFAVSAIRIAGCHTTGLTQRAHSVHLVPVLSHSMQAGSAADGEHCKRWRGGAVRVCKAAAARGTRKQTWRDTLGVARNNHLRTGSPASKESRPPCGSGAST